MTLEFERQGQWYEATKCGRYTMSASKVDGKFVFCAHVLATKETIGCRTDAEEARQLCRDHAHVPETDFATHCEQQR